MICVTDTTPLRPPGRIDIVDAFRGFALAGIVVTHMVEHYIATAPSPELAASFAPTVLDQVVQGLMFILINGKFFALFSFLFGLSFYIQMDRAAQRGIEYRGRFLWRLTILLAIGYAHSLFYRGDILSIYAVLGFLLVLFHNVRSNVLLTIAAIILLGAFRYGTFAIYGGATIFPYGDFSPELPYNTAYLDALKNGSLADVFSANALYGQLSRLEFQLGYFSRWYLTFAFFLLGLWAGRVQLFLKLDEWHGRFKKALGFSIASAVVFFVLMAILFSQGGGLQFDRWINMFAISMLDLFNLSLAIVYLCSFVLIFMRPGGGRVLGKLAPYGRTALSNYVLQTLVGTFILYNWGLGLITEISNSQALLIGVSIFLVQAMLSAVWLRHFRFGPLEWLWRSATYFSWQPLLKNR